MACVANGCKSHMGILTEKNAKISFHRFPKEQKLKQKWVRNLKRGDDWSPTKYSRICGLHFEDSYFREGLERKTLHSYAVPTIFPNEPSHTQKKLTMKRRPIMKVSDAIASTSTSDATEDKEEEMKPPKTRRRMLTDGDATASASTFIKKSEDNEERKNAALQLEHYKQLAARRGRKLKNLQRKYSRLVKKNSNLESILIDLKRKMEGEQLAILQNTLDSDNQVLSRYLMKLKGVSLPNEYPIEVKKFALTLQFLSPKAYNFVRASFNTVLPHPKTISRWYQVVECNPGFTKESLDTIKLRSAAPVKTLYCALSIDEMAIRKQLQWDGNKYYGHIDIGSDFQGDNLPLATEALTFIVTCINEPWKIPVGYFLINGLTGEQKCNLVEQCIQLLNETGVKTVSLTFDGAATNASMVSQLGCILNPADLRTTFKVGDQEVAILYDPCHNIKLWQGLLEIH